jgi:peptide/nickel transport system substrate-binding protein
LSPARFRRALLLLTLAALPFGAGCGGDDEQTPGAGSAVSGGGTLAYAIPDHVRELDPLLAASPGEQLVTRQIHEPLVASLSAPFGDARRLRGLAISWRSSPDREIWSLQLRKGIRFQDGVPLNSSAVLANAERWRTLPAGRALIPELVAADAPRPDLVRFILSSPVPDFPRRLASPRLGIVSPRSLRPHSGTGAELASADRSGTGPFELREGAPAASVLLAANTGWWGTRVGLGPALDQVQFEVEPSGERRLELLSAGAVQVAAGLAPGAAPDLRRDPLLTYLRGGGGVLGLERSVRGIHSATAIEPLSGVWLTVVGAGDEG